jgi:hypothetical protein
VPEIEYTREQLEPSKPRKSYVLDFRAKAVSGKNKTSSYGSNISGLAVAGHTLFCASDETSSIERLDFDDKTESFRTHQSYPLGKLFPQLAGAKKEADIEGLAIDGGYLWVAGSQSLKRSVAEPAPSLDAFVPIEWDVKRAVLGRVPVTTDAEGKPTLAASEGSRRAAMMPIGKTSNDGLRGLLKNHPLLKGFIDLPSKENGLDIEGLAVSNGTVVLGLRGPVLASHALLIVLSFDEGGNGMLVPRPVNNKQYRIHAVHLDGLGIRDLLFDGDRLIVLGGPTQKIESVQRVFAIDDFLARPDVIAKDERRLLMTLPFVAWGDHAEGIAFFKDKTRLRMLVAYDSASPDRWDEDKDRLKIDAFDLPD